MTAETRTVHFTIAPVVAAYFEWLDGQPGRVFVVEEYDTFVSGYRARVAEEAAEHLSMNPEEGAQ